MYQALLATKHHGYYPDEKALTDAQSICNDSLTTWEQYLVKAGWKNKYSGQGRVEE